MSGWNRLVDAALREQVDAVLLSGDLLDESNKFWEAIGPFQSGISRLAAQGIRTLAVAGNHDADVLPRLAATLPRDQFHLIGAGGEWERVTLEKDGRPVLHVDGWSFPSSIHRQDPTRSYPGQSSPLPVLGMVHGDMGASESKYAPLSLSRLQSLSVDGWLLGHIHKPGFTPGGPWVLMPGSPHPLDPGEPDLHHAWQVEVKNGALTPPVPCCPAALMYRTLEIPLSRDTPPTLDGIHKAIRTQVDARDTAAYQVLRLRFTGETDAPEELEELTRSLTDWEDASACVEQVQLETTSLPDRERLREAGPVPARILEALDTLPPGLTVLLEEQIRKLSRQKEFSAHVLPDLRLEDLPVQSLLEKTLRAALEGGE